jgi:arylsulfatase A-like enzyme
MHDQLVRLDRALGVFLDSLYRLRDSARVALVLTADHGVAPIPELAPDSVRPRPTRVDVVPLIERTHAGLRAARADTDAVIIEPPIVVFDRAALARARVNADSLLTALAADARRVPGVLRADRWRDLLGADQARDATARRWVHQFPADARIELVMTLTPGSVWGPNGPVATHGSPHDYDTHVPLIFYGAAFRPGRYDAFVRTVDIAPTLAAVAGVEPMEQVDGVVLRKILR